MRGGNVRRTLANVATILARDDRWRGVIAFDAFGEEVVTLRPPPTRPSDAPAVQHVGAWTDEDSIRTATWLAAEFNIDPPTTMVDQAVATVARRAETHPVRDYLRSLSWDGTARLDRMLATYFGAKDTTYTRGVGSRWMISAVARVMEPGCQADCTLVLEGEQGGGKSTGLEALASKPWFADTGVSPGDKDSYQSLRRKWVYELGELTSVKGRDVERVKAFLSARSDNYRASYGRRNRDYPRQVVFAGSTNEREYLIDRTGNRRFWPVRGGLLVDVAGLLASRDQLWAEAVARYEAGEPWHVDTPEFRALCEAEQESRVHADAWLELVEAWLARPALTRRDHDHGGLETVLLDLDHGLLTSEVLQGAFGFKAAEIKRADEMRVAGILRELGFERGPRQREHGTVVRRYRRGGHVVDTDGGNTATSSNQPVSSV